MTSSEKGFSHLLVLGLAVLLLAGGYFFYNNTLNQNLPALPLSQPKPLTLTLESPTADTVAINDSILIKGQTLPNITVTLYSATDEQILQSDNQGNFQGKLILGEGVNSLTVSAFSETGEEKTLNLDIEYTPSS